MTDKYSVIDGMDIPGFYTDTLPTLKCGTRDEAKACCPFHDDRNPSLSVNLKTGLWFCHAGCGGGSVFDFVMKRDRLTFPEAVKVLQRRIEVNETHYKERQIIRAHWWFDGSGREAWKLRWSTGVKYTWAQDQHGRVPGRGLCKPTLYQRFALGKSILAAVVTEGERDADQCDDWLMESELFSISATCTPNGAADVKLEYFELLHGKGCVWVSGDNDKPGQDYMRNVAAALYGKVSQIRLLRVPEGSKDWAEWGEHGGTAAQFVELLKTSPLYMPENTPLPLSSSPREWVMKEEEWRPLTAPEFLRRAEAEPREWIWEDYIAAGRVVMIAGKPKEGKTTFAYELATNVVAGRPFLDRRTAGAPVLILALEEHPDDVAQRLEMYGAESLPGLHIHCGRLGPDQLDRIAQIIGEDKIRLVVFDTLAVFWHLNDETDASAVTRAIKPLVDLARTTNAAVLLIHHARKAEGSFGDEIRGSTALFAQIDLAMVLKRNNTPSQRVIHASGRNQVAPIELLIERQNDRYVALGDTEGAAKAAIRQKVKNALRDEQEDIKTILDRSGVKSGVGRTALETLYKDGEAERDRLKTTGTPYVYRRSLLSERHSLGEEKKTGEAPGG